MSIRSIAAATIFSGALAAGLLAATPAAMAQEPTIHQIYEAAEAGKFIEAQKMMDTVLAAHPNSAKAHFVEAELLAKQGKFSRAASELATAERLGPDMKFAKPEAVRELKAVLAAARPAALPSSRGVPANLAPADVAARPEAAPRSLPWGMLLGIGALAVLVMLYFKNRAAQRGGAAGFGNAGPGYPGGNTAPYMNSAHGGVPPQYGMPGGMAPPAAGGGLGAGIMGGLATGAALGAGMVAGQALAHHFTDSNNSNTGGGNRGGADTGSGLIDNGFAQNDTPPSGYDMGGGDFGVSDAGSWDSGGDSGGGSDWD